MLDSACQDSLSIVIEIDQKNSYDDYDTVEYRVRFNTEVWQIDQKQFFNNGRWRWRLLGRVRRYFDGSFGHNHFIDYFSNILREK